MRNPGIRFWLLVSAAPLLFPTDASCQSAAPAIVSCKLRGGSILQVTADVCEKEGGQNLAAGRAIDKSAEHLYATWEANNRTYHDTALAAGEEFLAAAPGDPRAPKVSAWVMAYRKVRASGAEPASERAGGTVPASAAAREDRPREGPTLAETKQWIISYLSNAERVPPNASTRGGDGIFLKTVSVVFDQCVLKERTSARLQNGGLMPLSITHKEAMVFERSIPFDRVDPSSIRTSLWTGGQNQALSGVTINGVGIQTSSKALAISQNVYENDGTYEAPVNGKPFSNKYSFFPYSSGAKSGVFFQTTTAEDAARLANALKRLTHLCGGKVDPF